MTGIDDELRAQFDARRADDRQTLPEFHAMVVAATDRAAPHRSRRRLYWSLGGGLALAAALIALIARTRAAQPRDVPIDLDVIYWTPPTDVLLHHAARMTQLSSSLTGN